ncbi:MAG: Orn/DAP/Arg decarboxylase 2, partial [Acidobacteria bacterium]|nr:Orn/DAP/Arg decarboxylase 2 [Acidobacteriota bacterium]
MVKSAVLKDLAQKHGTPLFILDHDELRSNYAAFRRYLPRVQPYYAVKANADPAIIRTLYATGSSFDVASIAEFNLVFENIKKLPADDRQNFIWDKIIYSNPIKDRRTLEELDQYKPLVAYDNSEEITKIRKHAPHAGLALRIRVPNTGSMVELSSKFGASPAEAVDLIAKAFDAGLVVEGLGFHVGSQCTNFENYVQAISTSASIFEEAETRGYTLKL